MAWSNCLNQANGWGGAPPFLKRFVNIPFSSSARWNIIHGFSAPRLEQQGGAKAQLLSRSSTRRSSFHGGGVCGRGGRKSLAVVVVLPNTGTLLTVEIEIIGHILVML